MSEIITTRSLGYSVDAGRNGSDFVARLINPNKKQADYGFFDPGTGVLSIYHKDAEGYYEQFDSGYPTDEFLTAMRNYRDESGLPQYSVAVEELGLDAGAGNDNLESPGRPIHKLKVMSLEESPVIDVIPIGHDPDNDRYVYVVTLENQHSFELRVRTVKAPERMLTPRCKGHSVFIDGIEINIFAKYKDFGYTSEKEDFSEKVSKRIAYLIKIYFDKKINTTLENQD